MSILIHPETSRSHSFFCGTDNVKTHRQNSYYMLDTLELQTIQVKLYQASFSKSLRTKREALIYYKTHIGYSLDNQHESIFKEIARHNGIVCKSNPG